MEISSDILCGSKRVGNVGLRAGAGPEWADFRARFVLVVEPLVGRFWCRGLPSRRLGAPGGVPWLFNVSVPLASDADYRGVAGNGEVAAEAERKGTHSAAKRGRRRIVGQDYVRKLFRGDARPRDFDFVFARSRRRRNSFRGRLSLWDWQALASGQRRNRSALAACTAGRMRAWRRRAQWLPPAGRRAN